MIGKEALERLKEETQPNAYTLNHNDKDFAIIEKSLKRLEKLEKENKILKKAIENSNKAYDVLMQNSNIQFLNQNQEIFKLKKVIEILKRQNDGQTTSQEEDDLLKRYFRNE